MVNAYRLLARSCDYPLHLGVTEAGPTFQGTIKSAVAFGALLAEGIGDTIRVSLSAPPGRGSQGRHLHPGVTRHAAAAAGDRVLPVLRPSPGRRVQAGRGGDRRAGRPGGPAAGRGHGLRRQWPRRGPRGGSRCRLRQRQGPDLRPRRGHRDRARVRHRGDPDRRGHAPRRAERGQQRRGARRRRRARQRQARRYRLLSTSQPRTTPPRAPACRNRR